MNQFSFNHKGKIFNELLEAVEYAKQTITDEHDWYIKNDLPTFKFDLNGKCRKCGLRVGLMLSYHTESILLLTWSFDLDPGDEWDCDSRIMKKALG